MNCKCMITEAMLQRGEGKLKSLDPKVGHETQRRKVAYEDAQMEEGRNYCKAFYAMKEKVDKLFAE